MQIPYLLYWIAGATPTEDWQTAGVVPINLKRSRASKNGHTTKVFYHRSGHIYLLFGDLSQGQ